MVVYILKFEFLSVNSYSVVIYSTLVDYVKNQEII